MERHKSAVSSGWGSGDACESSSGRPAAPAGRCDSGDGQLAKNQRAAPEAGGLSGAENPCATEFNGVGLS